MRILISYEDSHRVYAEAMRHAIRGLRPSAEVATCVIAELGAGVGGLDPDRVVASRPTTVDPGRRTAWYVLSPEPDEPSEVCVGGRRREVMNPGMEGLLSVLDETEGSVRTGRGSGGC